MQKRWLAEQFAKRVNEMTALKKRVKKQGRLSEFDVIFLKNYDYYMENLNNSLALLKESQFDELCQAAKEQNAICHNQYKEELLYMKEGDVTVTNFNDVSIDPCLMDLADIIKRYIKYFGDGRLCLAEILEMYTKTNDLSDAEIQALYPLLLYPTKFIKICNQYYVKNRSMGSKRHPCQNHKPYQQKKCDRAVHQLLLWKTIDSVEKSLGF